MSLEVYWLELFLAFLQNHELRLHIMVWLLTLVLLFPYMAPYTPELAKPQEVESVPHMEFPKIRLGVLIIRIILFRVPY